MKGLVCTWVLVFSVLSRCHCSDGIGVVNKRMRRFNKKINNFKIELAQMDTDLHDSIDVAKESLRLDLTQLFKQQIDEAMAEFRESVSVPEVDSPRVDSEIQRLKQGHHHMKRQLHSVMKTLRDVQLEKNMYRDAFNKAERSLTESCSMCGRDTKLLKNVLKQCNRFNVKPHVGDDFTDKENANLTLVLERLSLTCKEEIKQSLSSPMSSATTTSISPPTTMTPVQQPPVMNRMIIGHYMASELSQINLENNRLSKYPLPLSGRVLSLCFVHTLQRLLIGTRYTANITSTSLDGKDTQTLRESVIANGISVDEGRQLVFIATLGPRHSISSMTTMGKKFTVIRNLTGKYRNPHAIAVNPKERKIYASSSQSIVFKLNYNGKVLRTLATGEMSGVSFDSVRHILYFSDDRNLKKMSMSDEVISDVTTLRVKPFTQTYYNDTVYYGGVYGTHYVGAVQLGEKITDARLLKLNYQYYRHLIVCLVP